jgi:uncharacterized protein (DUF2126 family)
VLHSALCCEIRNGQLYVFMPPFTTAEAFVELVTLIERVAKKLNQPIILEGYPPAKDPRISLFRITPDPGVIEVNVPPCKSWEELTEQTETLYREAKEIGLAAGKFAIDGRATGTGGGCHITLGGECPQESPFLQRPELLASLVFYWPNLSSTEDR